LVIVGRFMKQSMHRRKFLLMGGLATAGALCAGGVGPICAAKVAESGALDFIRRYSDNFVVRQAGERVTRITAEVRDISMLAAAFQSARRHGIVRIQAGGTICSFKIDQQTFEVESLCPAEFAAQTS
jgi:hypothetical protein